MARIIVIGAGMAGLAAAARLATRDNDVVVCEASAHVGGALGSWQHDDLTFDTGAYTLTLPAVYRDLFIKTGSRKKSAADALEDRVDLRPVDPVRRYIFPDGTRLDLPNASRGRLRAAFDDALGSGAGDAWLRVIDHGSTVWDTIRPALVESPGSGGRELSRLLRTADGRRALTPTRSLRDLADRGLADPRLLLVLDDYARQAGAGADPRRAPAVLSARPYVEHAFGAWRVVGGMHRLAEELAQRVLDRGAQIRYGERVVGIETSGSGRGGGGGGGAGGVLGVDGARGVEGQRDAEGTLSVGGGRGVDGARGVESGRDGEAELGVDGPRGADGARGVGGGRGLGGMRSVSGLRSAVTGVLLESGERLAADVVVAAVDRAVLARLLHRPGLGWPQRRVHYTPGATTLCLVIDDAPPMPHETVLLGSRGAALRVHVAAEQPSAWTVHAPGDHEPEAVLAALAARGFDVRDKVRAQHTITVADHEAATGVPGGAAYGPAVTGLRSALLRSPVAGRRRGLFHVGASARPGSGLPFVALSGWQAAELIKASG